MAMKIIKGIPVSPGIGVGPVQRLLQNAQSVVKRRIGKKHVQKETKRYDNAVSLTIDQINELNDGFANRAGIEYGAIFKAHVQILQDPSLHKRVHARINDNLDNAEFAVYEILQELITTLSAIEDDYLSHRAPDIEDIRTRLVNNLRGKRKKKTKKELSGILVGHNIDPSQTATMDERSVFGLVLETGGPTSHTAIMARAMNIPAVFGVSNINNEVCEDDVIIIDGNKGVAIINPTEEMLTRYRKKKAQTRSMYRSLEKEAALPSETLDGRQVDITANIEFPSEISQVMRYGAKGIGLYRTEFLVIDQKEPDISEDTQVRLYTDAIKKLKGEPLTIRTFDLGADKASSLVGTYSHKEENPFLGCRSLRFCFDKPELFITQLRAILRASTSGPVRLLFPMVSDRTELRKALAMLEEARGQLRGEGIAFAETLPIGIMIEVPSAVIVADSLAEDVDFFSIGTNDLVQYTIAVDRGNEKIAHLYMPHNPAILRMLHSTIKTGQKHGVEVCVCGEMAGDVAYTMLLLGMGLTHFSVIASTIPQLKRIIRSVNYYEAREFANEILTLQDHISVRAAIDAKNESLIPKALRAS